MPPPVVPEPESHASGAACRRPSHEVAGVLAERTAIVTVGVVSVMVMTKAWAWWATGSLAVLGSLFDSAADLSISVVNLVVVAHARTPADKEHRFGHGKAEALAALAQSVVIAVSALYLLREAAYVALSPTPPTWNVAGMAVLGLSAALTFGLVRLQKRAVRRTGSVALEADSEHYAGDLWMNVGLLAGLALSYVTGWIYVEPALAAIVAAILLRAAIRICGRASGQLMDRELDDAERESVRRTILSHPQVRGLHDLRTRRAGLSTFVQCHVELDHDMTLLDAHAVADEIEASVRGLFGDAEVLVHQDPVGLETVSELERT